ncbi:hypothetical protein L4D77_18310 [Photobacterium frigidiphilum]|uniref:hypothetical protein n=1 Tax=Photobacterium frigidiphilum TaxID=264736 RepID=UPI003D142084
MTILNTNNSVLYDGTDVQKIFPFTFKIFNKSDLRITLITGNISKILSLNTDYFIRGIDFDIGGDVELVIAPTRHQKLLIDREVNSLQETSFRNLGNFYPEAHEDAFDKVYMLLQYISWLSEHSIHESKIYPGHWDFEKMESLNVPFPNRMDGVANPEYVMQKINEAIGAEWGAELKYWDGIIQNGVYEYTISGAEIKDTKPYRVVLAGIPQRPDKDFSIVIADNQVDSKIVFVPPTDLSKWPVGKNWWSICTGKAVPIGDAPWYRYEEVVTQDKTSFTPPVVFAKGMVFVDDKYQPTAKYTIPDNTNSIVMKVPVTAGQTFTAYLNIRLDQIVDHHDLDNPVKRIKGNLGSWKTGPDVVLDLVSDFGGAKKNGDPLEKFEVAKAVQDSEATSLKQVKDLIGDSGPKIEIITFDTPAVIFPLGPLADNTLVDIPVAALGIPDGSLVNVNFSAYPDQSGTNTPQVYIYGLITHGDSLAIASRNTCNFMCAGRDEREDRKDYIILFAGSGQVQAMVQAGKVRVSRTKADGANQCNFTAAISSYIKGAGHVTPIPPGSLEAIMTTKKSSNSTICEPDAADKGTLTPRNMGTNKINLVSGGKYAGIEIKFDTLAPSVALPYDYIYMMLGGREFSAGADSAKQEFYNGVSEEMLAFYDAMATADPDPKGIRFVPYLDTATITTALISGEPSDYAALRGFDLTHGALTPNKIEGYEIVSYYAQYGILVELRFKGDLQPFDFINVTIDKKQYRFTKKSNKSYGLETTGSANHNIAAWFQNNVGVARPTTILQAPRKNA